jgi:hypothetical protein
VVQQPAVHERIADIHGLRLVLRDSRRPQQPRHRLAACHMNVDCQCSNETCHLPLMHLADH